MMKEMAEILIEGVRYSFDPETEYMKDGHAYCKNCHERKDGEVRNLMDMKFIFKNSCKCDRERFEKQKQREKEQEIVRLKRSCFISMSQWAYTFDNYKGEKDKSYIIAKNYVKEYEQMKKENIGLLFCGKVGSGKTSFIEKLALFSEWYCSLNNIKGKDAVSNLVGKVVVELEEFVALRNAKSADEAKLFISARTSTVRLPYERFSADVKRTCILITTINDATFLGDFSGERRYLPVKVNSENIELPIMYDAEKFPVLKTITREEHRNIVQHDFEGAIAEAVYIYENKLHDFYLPKELRTDLDYVIQTHKSENRHVQNFLDFMEWKSAKSDTPDLLCFAEFTSRYPETNEKVFSELMASEMADEWKLEPSIKSKKVRIDGVVRVSKKFYKRSINTDFVEVNAEDCHSKSFEKVRYRYFATSKRR